MNIIWQYLDKRSAAVNALKDYSSMTYILAHTDEEIAQVHEDTTTLGSPALQICRAEVRTRSPAKCELSLLLTKLTCCGNGIVRQRNTWNGFSLHGTACRRMNGMCWNSSIGMRKMPLMLFPQSATVFTLSGVLHTNAKTVRFPS